MDILIIRIKCVCVCLCIRVRSESNDISNTHRKNKTAHNKNGDDLLNLYSITNTHTIGIDIKAPSFRKNCINWNEKQHIIHDHQFECVRIDINLTMQLDQCVIRLQVIGNGFFALFLLISFLNTKIHIKTTTETVRKTIMCVLQ